MVVRMNGLPEQTELRRRSHANTWRAACSDSICEMPLAIAKPDYSGLWKLEWNGKKYYTKCAFSITRHALAFWRRNSEHSELPERIPFSHRTLAGTDRDFRPGKTAAAATQRQLHFIQPAVMVRSDMEEGIVEWRHSFLERILA